MPLTNPNISHDEVVSVNNALTEYDYMKEEIKRLNTSTVHPNANLFRKQCYVIVWNVEKNTENKKKSVAKAKKEKRKKRKKKKRKIDGFIKIY